LIDHETELPAPNVSERIVTSESYQPASECDPQYGECYYPRHRFARWPVLGPLERRWYAYTKPRLQACHWGYPEYFVERPFGTQTLQAEQMQIVNGLRDQQVLYDYDFYPGDRAAELSPRGHYQLRKIIQRMEIVPSPIILQTAIVDPKLDEARKQHVLDALAAAGVPAVPEIVIVDHPALPGLQGVEGTLIYNNLLQQTQQRGGGFSLDSGNGGGGSINIGNVNLSRP
jgi:hypothetical protein